MIFMRKQGLLPLKIGANRLTWQIFGLRKEYVVYVMLLKMKFIYWVNFISIHVKEKHFMTV